MANRNWASGGKIYSMHVSPVQLDCNFVVDATNANGISDLKGPAVQAVYMHSTNGTPSSYNPASGTILVQLQDAYNRVFAGVSGQIVSPASGSDVKIDNSAMTAGVAYRITTLGNATAAKWLAIGVPRGITPAVGVSFIALSNGGAGNTLTSRVQAAASAGSSVASIELAHDPQYTVSPNPNANQGYGAYLILQCRDYAGALVAPVAGSKISLEIYLSNSSITVQGE